MNINVFSFVRWVIVSINVILYDFLKSDVKGFWYLIPFVAIQIILFVDIEEK